MGKLIRITSHYFVAGVVLDEKQDKIVQAAPILRKALMGRSESEIKKVCKQRRWTIDCVTSLFLILALLLFQHRS